MIRRERDCHALSEFAHIPSRAQVVRSWRHVFNSPQTAGRDRVKARDNRHPTLEMCRHFTWPLSAQTVAQAARSAGLGFVRSTRVIEFVRLKFDFSYSDQCLSPSG
jgi:hypothetical protein